MLNHFKNLNNKNKNKYSHSDFNFDNKVPANNLYLPKTQNYKEDLTYLMKNANLNNGGYVFDVMNSAIYFLDRENSLENSLSFAGPANYCPVIVGIIQNIIKNS